MSMMSAPAAIMRRACSSARSGALKRPPSENESGVTLRMPITAGEALASSARSKGCAAAAGAERGLGEVTLMAWLCAVPASESRCALRCHGRQLTLSIADLRFQLACLFDDL